MPDTCVEHRILPLLQRTGTAEHRHFPVLSKRPILTTSYLISKFNTFVAIATATKYSTSICRVGYKDAQVPPGFTAVPLRVPPSGLSKGREQHTADSTAPVPVSQRPV